MDKIEANVNLRDRFSGYEVYFIADEDADGWYTSDPGVEDASRCGYNLAAFIYDTDPSVHPDFSCGVYLDEDNCTETPANTNKKSSCLGIQKGLVKATLDPFTKKIEYSEVDPNNCWTSKSWFDTAFKSSPGVNVTHLFDLPFKQEANGRFEFDSDKWLNASGRLIGGFFPEILHNAPPDPSCPSCNTKRTAEVFTPLISAISAETFDSYVSIGGDFASGSIPTIGTVLGTTAAGSVWDWSGKDNLTWYLHGSVPIRGSEKSKANQHFCFESHAEFIYQKGQVFDFRGDDAIWIYIDNRLVVDLGGSHMAAPGRVNLDAMDLVEGNKYSIDIFFCDMRTPQSNVRISTNMYITQKNNYTPIVNATIVSNVGIRTTGNAIMLNNLPTNAKVEVYNIHGKQIYMGNPENLKILKIMVQTKGMYIVKVSKGVLHTPTVFRIPVM
jgi:fibro-slime domain-containing protein